MEDTSQLVKLVENLADEMKWNWTHATDARAAADNVLSLMADLGLVEHREHPLGGDIWTIQGQNFGRTDGL